MLEILRMIMKQTKESRSTRQKIGTCLEKVFFRVGGGGGGGGINLQTGGIKFDIKKVGRGG
jgi:hypothetical protein